MTILHPPKVVVLGMMTKIPVAGAVWGTLQYLIGLRRLGPAWFGALLTPWFVNLVLVPDAAPAAAPGTAAEFDLPCGTLGFLHARYGELHVLCCSLLSDLGADVVRIDRTGETGREWTGYLEGAVESGETVAERLLSGVSSDASPR